MGLKKIGCVLAYQKDHTNYGTFLQGFAMIKLIKGLGYDPKIIKYIKKRSLTELLKVFPLYLLAGGWGMLKVSLKKKIYRKLYIDYNSFMEKRIHKVNVTQTKYMEPFCDEYIGYDSLKEGSKKYNLVIAGSDQIWLPLSLYSNFFNLVFVDAAVPKVAYSSSFGVSSIPRWQHKMTKFYLDRLDKIGVREQSGKHIVETISSNTAKVVLDPTLLVEKKQWEEYINDIQSITKRPYIFTYLLGASPEHRRAIEELKKRTGYPIVTTKYMGEFVKADRMFGDIAPQNTGPFEFLKYIKDAAYVCTDSFHCTAYSVSFNKLFLTFYRYKNNTNSPNTRIDSFLGLFDLQDRIYDGVDIIKQINGTIDYNFINDRLKELRKDSFDFLKSQLELSA